MTNPDTNRVDRPGRDPRLDRAVNYGLATVLTVALAVLGWSYRTVSERLDAIGAKLEGVAKTLAVLESGGLEPRVRMLEERTTRLEVSAGTGRVRER